MADPAFVLLRDPVQIVGSDGGELPGWDGREGDVTREKQGFDDDEVEVVSAVSPDSEERGEVEWCYGRVDVVE